MGTYYFRAVYSGDNNYASSFSAVASLTVNPQVSSSTTVVLSSSTINLGGSVTVTATVSGGAGVPSGSVQFYVSTNYGNGFGFPNSWSALGGAVSLNGLGSATSISYTPLSASSLFYPWYAFYAVYNGDSSYLSSQSAVESLTVNPAAISTVTALHGLAVADQSAITGVSINISGSSLADGTKVAVGTIYFGNTQPSGTGSTLVDDGGVFYDVSATSNTPLGIDVAGTITITNPTFTPASVVYYWNGATWIPVPTLFIAPDNVTFTLPASDLTGTPIMVQPNGSLFAMPGILVNGALAVLLSCFVAVAVFKRQHLKIR